jgi:N-acylneuraminate cytidylyltransferase
MLEWTLEAAVESGQFDRILVSTDDPSIADVAHAFGVEVPFLRDAAADDFSPVSLATRRALDQARDHWREDFSAVVQLMPNCPLRDAETIVRSIENFEQGAALYQISCCRFGWMNPWWAFSVSDDGTASRVFPELSSRRSQDLPELFFPTGAIWIADYPAFMQSGDFYASGHVFFEIPWHDGVDIDDWDDFRFAEVAAMHASRQSAADG